MTVPARRPEDDALDALAYASREMPHAPIGRFAADVLAVREALERLRSVKAIAQIKELLERAEAAEAEVRRLTEGLRERDEIIDCLLQRGHFDPFVPLAAFRKIVPKGAYSVETYDEEKEWLARIEARALLSASPSDGGEPWESFASSQGGIFNGPHPADEEPDGGGA